MKRKKKFEEHNVEKRQKMEEERIERFEKYISENHQNVEAKIPLIFRDELHTEIEEFYSYCQSKFNGNDPNSYVTIFFLISKRNNSQFCALSQI
jgi:hypothetical protein